MQKKKEESVNVHDQALMIELGIHPPYREIYDFSKTPKEKADLLTYKRKDGRGFYTRGVYKKPYSIPVYDKLIIYVKEDGTRSINCGQSDIPDILFRLKKDKKTVLKYQWNGRTYQSNEIPFWKPKVHSGTSVSVRSYAV
jgi:hypothetical protein